jgi:hypothetical protein
LVGCVDSAIAATLVLEFLRSLGGHAGTKHAAHRAIATREFMGAETLMATGMPRDDSADTP